VKERNKYAAKVLCNKRFEIEYCILNDIDRLQIADFDGKYKFWNLQFDFERYFDRAIQFNEDEVCELLIDNYRDFVGTAIPKLIPQGFAIKHQRLGYDKADAITSAFHKIYEVHKLAMHYKKTNLYRSVCNSFFTLALKIIKADFDSSGKDHLFTVLANIEYDCFDSYTKSDLISSLSYLECPFKYSVDSIKATNTTYPFRLFLKAIDVLFYRSKLNNVILNTFKADVMGLCREIKGDDRVLNITIIAIGKFTELGKLVSSDSSDYQKEFYIKCKQYLNIIKGYCTEEAIINSELMENLASATEAFKKEEEFKLELESKGYVFDEATRS
jgi:hypothetical protein